MKSYLWVTGLSATFTFSDAVDWPLRVVAGICLLVACLVGTALLLQRVARR